MATATESIFIILLQFGQLTGRKIMSRVKCPDILAARACFATEEVQLTQIFMYLSMFIIIIICKTKLLIN